MGDSIERAPSGGTEADQPSRSCPLGVEISEVDTLMMVPTTPRMARPEPGIDRNENASLAAPVLPSPGALRPAASRKAG